MNEEYMIRCYDAAYQAQNHGFLTLVSPGYFQFGTALLTKIVSVFNQSRLKREGNKAALLALEEVKSDQSLRHLFLECSTVFGELELKEK